MPKSYLIENPKSGIKDIPMIGLKFGKLEVKEYCGLNKHGNKLWKCLCDCGAEAIIFTTALRSGKRTKCGHSCNYKKKGEEVYNYSGYQDITGTKWNSIMCGAKSRNLELKVTKEEVWNLFEKQDRLCAMTGIPISFKLGTASVDRINSKIGYTKENIQIVHKDINRIKNEFSVDYFVEMCTRVVNWRKIDA